MTAWQEKKQGIIRMYEGTDASYSEIGAEFGVKRNTVAGVIHRAGIKRRGGKKLFLSDEIKADVFALRDSGWTQKAIAQALGISVKCVHYTLKRSAAKPSSQILEEA